MQPADVVAGSPLVTIDKKCRRKKKNLPEISHFVSVDKRVRGNDLIGKNYLYGSLLAGLKFQA